MSEQESTLSNGSQRALQRLEEENALGSLNDGIAYIRGQRHLHEIPFTEWEKVMTWCDGEVCLEYEDEGRVVWVGADPADRTALLALEPLPNNAEEEVEVVETSRVAVRAMVEAYDISLVHRDETGFTTDA